MSSLLSRISQIAASEGITITSLEKNIGASKGVLSRAIKNDTDIQAKWLEKIANIYPQYSCLWLLTGNGDMCSDSPIFKGDENYPQSRLVSKNGEENSLSITLLNMLQNKDALITTQAEEIGRLKAENERLREEAQKQSRHERGLLTHDNVASRP